MSNKRLQPHPAKLAQGVLKAALEAGAITQPVCCELCGAERQTFAHQATPLDNPLAVVWWCSECRTRHRNAERVSRKLRRIQEILKEG